MQEKRKFTAEVDKVLSLMINSLYTNKEIAIRELISNASDACDKARYESQVKNVQNEDFSDLKITISIDKDEKNLSIRDNGIGMDKEDLAKNLGTIANSGTQEFLKNLQGDKKKDSQLIGQFGVGFYSAFMIADKITVTSKKIGTDKAYIWHSDGSGEYSILDEADPNFTRGTEVKLHIKEDQKKFLEFFHIKHLIQSYSDHVHFPIFFTEKDKDDVKLNASSALWSKSSSEIDQKDYNEFYKKIAHDMKDPWITIHYKSEGALSFTNLLFIPSEKPFDLIYSHEIKNRIKLYVRKVFITEENLDIIPNYLNFVRGIVDSEDLPLNISRETLQHNAQISKIKASITNKVLSELKKKKNSEFVEYQKFWNIFGEIIKSGLIQQFNEEEKNKILELSLFNSAIHKKLISIEEYIASIKNEKKEIYYLIGDSLEELYSNPQIEGFLDKSIDVLLLTDKVDNEWVIINKYKEFEFKSVTRSNIDLDTVKSDTKKDQKDKKSDLTTQDEAHNEELIKSFKNELGERVSSVKISKKLTSSPACLSVDEKASYDIKLESLLISHGHLKKSSSKILEINPNNNLIKKIDKYLKLENSDKEKAKELINLVYDQACIIVGVPIQNPNAFVKRLNSMLDLI